MMLKKREERRGARSRWVGNRVGGQFSAVTALTRAGLAAANFSQRLLGDSVQGAITGAFRKLSGDRLPLWNRYMPSAGALPNLEPNPKAERPRVVYFPSCASRSMGPAQGDPETCLLYTSRCV